MSNKKLTLKQASGRSEAAAPTARPSPEVPPPAASPQSNASLATLHGPRGVLSGTGGRAEIFSSEKSYLTWPRRRRDPPPRESSTE